MSAPAIALNRFGLGARPEEPAPADPQRWLLSQLDAYEALPAAWTPLPLTPALMQVWLEQQRAVRQAIVLFFAGAQHRGKLIEFLRNGLQLR